MTTPKASRFQQETAGTPEDSWANIATYPDRISAEAVLGLLQAGDVLGYIASNEFHSRTRL